MTDFFNALEGKGITLPVHIVNLLETCHSYRVFNSSLELAEASTAGKASFDVVYDIEGKGAYTEAVIHRVKNGISANYTEAYMRRRDPDTMVIADTLPSDKPRIQGSFRV